MSRDRWFIVLLDLSCGQAQRMYEKAAGQQSSDQLQELNLGRQEGVGR